MVNPNRAEQTGRAAQQAPELLCYPEYEGAPEIIAGRSARDWMDATAQRFAYRCTPLAIANATGWEITLPFSFSATWNGGPLVSDVWTFLEGWDSRYRQVVSSVFGNGVLTFHPGWLFRTSPGWALIARGPPNTPRDGIAPLEGLVETDWLPFTFTMNWRFTRPGTVRFGKGECFCFITPVPHETYDTIRPRIRSLDDDPDLKAAYDDWRSRRSAFQARVAVGEPDAIRAGWQRDYIAGRDPTGSAGPAFHRTKRVLPKPVR